MREWLQKLNDPARDPYERRYRLFSLLGITLIALWTAVVSFVDYNPLRFVFLAGILLVYIPTMIITLRTGRIQIGAGLSAIIAVYIMTPFLFFYDGGITAGVFNYAAASLVFIMMTMSGRFRTVMIVSDVVVIIACFALSYHYPTWVNPLGREASYVDAAISLLATLVVTGTAILFQLYMFRQERDILKEQQNKVADLNRSQNNFFSSMSHEIRTPINTIIGMNELILRDKTVSKEIAQDAEAIQGASRMLLALINDILDMSKIESGNMDIVEVTYDVSQLLLEVVGMIKDRAKEKGLAFNLDVDPSIPVMLCGDELRIKQVLVNLLNNAVKYTAEGSITMSVQGDTVNSNHVRLHFCIEDTGIGIKKEAMPDLFDAFKRVDVKRNRYIEGTGLGLSIVKQIVTLMGGEIQVDSVYMKGSTFTVSFDQEIVDERSIGELNLDTKQGEEKRSLYRQSFEAPNARLLIVDDNRMNLFVESRLLSETKIQIDTAMSGNEALKLTSSVRYDVIFMDHLMPEMDGITCLKRIREQEGGLNKDTAIVALTANAGSENLQLYAASGFDGFLLKPVSGSKLESTLLKLLPADKVNMTGASTMQSQSGTVFSWHTRKRQVLVTMDSGGDLPDKIIRRFGIQQINSD